MDKQKVYIETSVISYLTAKPSRDLIIAGHQRITQDWWKYAKPKFECYISQIVIEEISMGDSNAAAKRLYAVEDILNLEFTPLIDNLARKYMNLFGIPEKAKLDAYHLAFAVVNKIDILLSWNCKHIANALINIKLRDYNSNNSLFVPFLCTPQELLEV
jgi:hypothetical protein